MRLGVAASKRGLVWATKEKRFQIDATSIFTKISTKAIEFYKCLVLAVIAILLSIILFRTPTPLRLEIFKTVI